MDIDLGDCAGSSSTARKLYLINHNTCLVVSDVKSIEAHMTTLNYNK